MQRRSIKGKKRKKGIDTRGKAMYEEERKEGERRRGGRG